MCPLAKKKKTTNKTKQNRLNLLTEAVAFSVTVADLSEPEYFDSGHTHTLLLSQYSTAVLSHYYNS